MYVWSTDVIAVHVHLSYAKVANFKRPYFENGCELNKNEENSFRSESLK